MLQLKLSKAPCITRRRLWMRLSFSKRFVSFVLFSICFFNMFILQIRAAETELDVDSGIVQLLDDFIITGINGNRKSFQSYLKQYLKLIYLFFPKSRCLHGIRGARLESS